MKTTEHWTVECKPWGQHGYFFYHEGANELPLSWQYGGGDVVLIVGFDDPGNFALRYPWAAERKREILERIASEIIRQQAPGCSSEIDEGRLCIYLRRNGIR